jgi:hypothetical protein
MPEFTTVSVTEAQLQTTSGRQKTFLQDYVAYIQQLPRGQTGRLRVEESEDPLTIRRRLVSAAKAMNIHLIMKRSGNELYFWREDGGEDVSSKRRYTRRRRADEETAGQDQPIREAKSSASDDFEAHMTRLESEMPNSTL